MFAVIKFDNAAHRDNEQAEIFGPVSGNCPRCQNAEVASLERDLGLPARTLGRVKV